MKKLFVLLLALIVAAGAFAQVTVAGYDKAVVTYTNHEDDVTGDAGAGFSDEIRFNLTAKDADGKYGFSGRFQGTSQNATSNDFVVKYMYGWANFLDGMITLSAGRLNEGSFSFGQNEANSIQGNMDTEKAPGGTFGTVKITTFFDVTDIRTQSMELALNPMAGLKAAVIYTPAGADTELAGSDFKFGATYSVENLLNIKTMWMSSAENTAIAYDGGDILGHVSAEYVGVENLSAVAGVKIMNDTEDPFFGIYTIVGYTMDALFFEVAGQFNTETDILDASYYVEGNVEYTTEAYSVRAFGQFNDSEQDSVRLFDLGGVGDYLIGAELSLPVGGGEFNVGFNYGDESEFALPVYLKIAF
jgi:hypothetical protein